MTVVGTAVINILPNVGNFGAQLQNAVAPALSRLSSQVAAGVGPMNSYSAATERAALAQRALMDAAMVTGFVTAGRQVISWVREATQTMGHYAESLNAVNVAFGQLQGQRISDFLAMTGPSQPGRPITPTGLPMTSGGQLAANIGLLLQNTGYSQASSTNATLQLMQRAIDVASLRDVRGGPAEVLAALESGISGSSVRPLRRFGVDVTQGSLLAAARNQGMNIGVTDLQNDRELRSQLVIEQFMRQTRAAEGDFARTLPYSLPNQERELQRLREGVFLALGNAFVADGPLDDTRVVNDIYESLRTEVMPALTELAEAVGPTIANSLAMSLPALQAFANAIRVISDVVNLIPDELLSTYITMRTVGAGARVLTNPLGTRMLGGYGAGVLGGALQSLLSGTGGVDEFLGGQRPGAPAVDTSLAASRLRSEALLASLGYGAVGSAAATQRNAPPTTAATRQVVVPAQPEQPLVSAASGGAPLASSLSATGATAASQGFTYVGRGGFGPYPIPGADSGTYYSTLQGQLIGSIAQSQASQRAQAFAALQAAGLSEADAQALITKNSERSQTADAIRLRRKRLRMQFPGVPDGVLDAIARGQQPEFSGTPNYLAANRIAGQAARGAYDPFAVGMSLQMDAARRAVAALPQHFDPALAAFGYPGYNAFGSINFPPRPTRGAVPPPPVSNLDAYLGMAGPAASPFAGMYGVLDLGDEGGFTGDAYTGGERFLASSNRPVRGIDGYGGFGVADPALRARMGFMDRMRVQAFFARERLRGLPGRINAALPGTAGQRAGAGLNAGTGLLTSYSLGLMDDSPVSFAGGAFAGASAGAGIGMMFSPAGAAIGAGIGATVGAITTFIGAQQKMREELKRTREETLSFVDAQYAAADSVSAANVAIADQVEKQGGEFGEDVMRAVDGQNYRLRRILADPEQGRALVESLRAQGDPRFTDNPGASRLYGRGSSGDEDAANALELLLNQREEANRRRENPRQVLIEEIIAAEISAARAAAGDRGFSTNEPGLISRARSQYFDTAEGEGFLFAEMSAAGTLPEDMTLQSEAQRLYGNMGAVNEFAAGLRAVSPELAAEFQAQIRELRNAESALVTFRDEVLSSAAELDSFVAAVAGLYGEADAEAQRQRAEIAVQREFGAVGRTSFADSMEAITKDEEGTAESDAFDRGLLLLDRYDELVAVSNDWVNANREAASTIEEAQAIAVFGVDAVRGELEKMKDEAGLTADEVARIDGLLAGLDSDFEIAIRVRAEITGDPLAWQFYQDLKNNVVGPGGIYSDLSGGIVDSGLGFDPSTFVPGPQPPPGTLPAANGMLLNRGAQLVLAGEAGPEVIIPLTRPARARQLAQESGLLGILGMGGGTVTSSSTTTTNTPISIGQVIVNADSADEFIGSMLSYA